MGAMCIAQRTNDIDEKFSLLSIFSEAKRFVTYQRLCRFHPNLQVTAKIAVPTRMESTETLQNSQRFSAARMDNARVPQRVPG
jgi:hypothetical protein